MAKQINKDINKFKDLDFFKRKYKKIYFLHNKDSNSGDNVLMREFASRLNSDLVDFKNINDFKIHKNSLVFFANIDNHQQTINTIETIYGKSDLAIYALKHPFQGIIDFHISSNNLICFFSIQSYLFHLFVSRIITSIIYLKINIKIIRNFKDLLFLLSFRNLYYEKLKRINYIIASCKEEKKVLNKTLKNCEIKIIPHLVNLNYSKNKLSKSLDNKFVLIAGRSEKRKNIFATLKLIDKYKNIKFKVVLKTNCFNNKDTKYSKNLINELNKRPNVIIKINLSLEELMKTIKQCSILINPSWFEVSSMIDLWGLYFEKKIITTKNSYLEESNLVKLHNPLDKMSLIRKFDLFLEENNYEL